MEELFEINNILVSQVSVKHIRNLATKIDWDKRLIEIRGARGVGKTTMLLQQVKIKHSGSPQTGLYLSLDDPYFYSHSILDLADDFVKYGGEQLFLDEVHKYPPKHKQSDWSSEIKTIYDRYPNLRIVYTGSSILNLFIGKGDLSRRRVVYDMQGLSFREYLLIHEFFTYEPLSLATVIEENENISKEITSKIKILKHFREYLEYGYYPFHLEHKNLSTTDKPLYYYQLTDIISLILEIDIPSITDISFDKIVKLKKLLAVISTSAPYTPELKKIKNVIGITDDRTLLKYLHYLNEAAIVSALNRKAKGNQIFRKPDKLYLENTNLMYAISEPPINIGNVRETFFFNQLKNDYSVSYPEVGDFMINNYFIFEIGGKNKQGGQIKDINNSFIASDGIEYGFRNRVPLWLFGFLY